MQKLKMAVIGIGGMGNGHAGWIQNDIENTELTAVCDNDPDKLEKATEKFGVKGYASHQELLEAEELDGIVIATPHYDHTPIAIAAFEKGIHVMTEKPVGVHVGDAQKMTDAYDKAKEKFPELQYGVMFQQRSDAVNVTIKKMLTEGALGRLVRATWVITNWFRTQQYYDNGGWRATWKGEGGGVLLNQCPHQIDLYQWFFGVPDKITANASLGKYHDIEVEDEVSAMFRHDNGMIGQFAASTGESPGTNRLEVAGELGKLICEHGKLTFIKNRTSMLEGISNGTFDSKDIETLEIPLEKVEEQGHCSVLRRFCSTIAGKSTLVAHGREGINSLYISNGCLLSAFNDKPVLIPFEHQLFKKELDKLIEQSTSKKDINAKSKLYDLKKTFQEK